MYRKPEVKSNYEQKKNEIFAKKKKKKEKGELLILNQEGNQLDVNGFLHSKVSFIEALRFRFLIFYVINFDFLYD